MLLHKDYHCADIVWMFGKAMIWLERGFEQGSLISVEHIFKSELVLALTKHEIEDEIRFKGLLKKGKDNQWLMETIKRLGRNPAIQILFINILLWYKDFNDLRTSVMQIFRKLSLLKSQDAHNSNAYEA